VPPAYGQTSAYAAPTMAPQMNNMVDQFSQMGVGAQKALRLQTTNLVTSPPDPLDLARSPPDIILPPNACLTTSPYSNAPPSYQRSTLNAIPTTNSLLNKSKIPLALVLTPYRSVKEGDEQVPLVTDTVIARCRRCRTYINPYVQFIDGGNRWRCCMCSMSNEVPQLFDWDQTRNQPGDRWARAELNYSVVEFVAPTEYMVRPPQPAVYVFVIDVSHAAIQSGASTVPEYDPFSN
jgi:protein transport protein SEC24